MVNPQGGSNCYCLVSMASPSPPTTKFPTPQPQPPPCLHKPDGPPSFPGTGIGGSVPSDALTGLLSAALGHPLTRPLPPPPQCHIGQHTLF